MLWAARRMGGIKVAELNHQIQRKNQYMDNKYEGKQKITYNNDNKFSVSFGVRNRNRGLMIFCIQNLCRSSNFVFKTCTSDCNTLHVLEHCSVPVTIVIYTGDHCSTPVIIVTRRWPAVYLPHSEHNLCFISIANEQGNDTRQTSHNVVSSSAARRPPHCGWLQRNVI